CLWSLLIVFSGSGKVSQLRPSRKKDIPTEAEQSKKGTKNVGTVKTALSSQSERAGGCTD
ncbi:MAG: hypothetical protein MUF81_05700, partial [Verrucomicrobia bacterium]|nr:hypothetical protein [Verrucomicrobiota bacterium]